MNVIVEKCFNKIDDFNLCGLFCFESIIHNCKLLIVSTVSNDNKWTAQVSRLLFDVTVSYF